MRPVAGAGRNVVECRADTGCVVAATGHQR
jgi:hypothetical protein